MAESRFTDDFSTLYGSLRDSMDGATWRQTIQDMRRPKVLQGPEDMRLLINDIAPRYQVDPKLVEAVMGLESAGDFQAVSRKGAQGLMQLMPGTAKRFGVTDPYDPTQNITGGVKYLAHLQQLFPGRVDLQLAGYHAGEGAVLNAGRNIPNTHDGNLTTAQYVQAVLSRYQTGTPYTSKAAGRGGQPPVLDSGNVQAAMAAPTAQEQSPLFQEVRAALNAPIATAEPARQPPSQQQLTADAQLALAAPVVTPAPRSPFPTLPAVEQQLAEPEGLRYAPTGATLDPTGRERAYAPFPPQEGVEESGGRLLGGALSAGIGSVRRFLDFLPTLSQSVQGSNQPGVLAGIATLAQDLSAVLKPAQEATKPPIMDATFLDKVADAFGATTPAIVLGALSGGGVAGAGVAAFVESAQEAQSVKEQLVPLLGEQEANRRAMRSFGLNLALVGITDRFGVFGSRASAVTYLGKTILANDVQEAVQYEIERRQLAVLASHPQADALVAQGWERQGEQVVKGFAPADLGEVLAIATILGGTMGGAGLALTQAAEQQLPEVRDQVQAIQETEPGFTLAQGVEAANAPDAPPEDVPPPRWQRWAQAVLDLLPEASTAPTAGRFLGSETGAIGAPPLRAGATGLTPERYRTAQGGWRIPLKEMPSQELEIQDYIRQQGGITLANEELAGEFQAVLSRGETGTTGLQNNTGGLTVQQFAERAAEQGFLPTADKQSLLDALDRSVTQGHAVYSTYAIGYVPLLDDPHVQAGYQAVLDAVEALQPRTEEAVGGVRHRPEVYAEGQELIASGQFSYDDIRELFPNTTLNDTMAAALLQSMHTLGTELTTAAQQYLDAGAQVGSREEQSLMSTMALFAELDPQRLGVSAAQSRGLGILNDPLSGYTQFLNKLHQVLETAPDRTMQQIATRLVAAIPQPAKDTAYWQSHPEELQALFAEIEETSATRAPVEDAEALDRALHPWQARETQLPLFQAMTQLTRPGFEPFFLELWFNAMLSNPATHVVNAVSNTLTTVWAIPERFVAEQFGRGSTHGVARGEANAMLYGLVHGIQDAWAVAVRSWQQGQPQSGVGREFAREPVGTATNVGLDPANPFGRAVDFWFEYIGLASGGRLPTRALMAADEFFKMLNYRMELNALAYREAVQLGYDGTAFAEHVARVVSRPELHHLTAAAQTFAEVQTFQQALTPGSVGAALQAVSGLQVPIPWTDTTFPIGKVLVPFVQTPTNIARYATERTPLGFFYRSMQADLDAGGARADMAAAKLTLGTMAMLGMAGLALSGRLVGRAPEDPELRDIWLRAHPEYSVRLPGGMWVAIDRLDPVGMLAGMVADIVQVAGEATTPTERVLVAPLYAFMRNVGSKTYFRGLSDFFTAMSPQVGAKASTYGERVERYVSRTLSGIGQPSALVGALARADDPAEKDARGLIDALYVRLPGWAPGVGREAVPSRRTLGGEKVLYGYGFTPETLANTIRAFSPFRLGEGTVPLADAEILRHRMDLRLPQRSLPSGSLPPGAYARLSPDEAQQYPPQRLTPAQYERYAVLAAMNQAEAQKLGITIPERVVRDLTQSVATGYRAVQPQRGLSLGEMLDWVATTEEYRQATDGPDGGKEDLFKEVVHAYRQVGREVLLATDPTLRQQIEQGQAELTLRKLPIGQRPAAQRELEQSFREGQQQRLQGLGIR